MYMFDSCHAFNSSMDSADRSQYLSGECGSSDLESANACNPLESGDSRGRVQAQQAKSRRSYSCNSPEGVCEPTSNKPEWLKT